MPIRRYPTLRRRDWIAAVAERDTHTERRYPSYVLAERKAGISNGERTFELEPEREFSALVSGSIIFGRKHGQRGERLCRPGRLARTRCGALADGMSV